ncbi:MAG TPA: hypothetical protein VFB20_10455 [Burkholderiales bacterium]|nr:hypothetical protein [Burkholderiales bacterium]
MNTWRIAATIALAIAVAAGCASKQVNVGIDLATARALPDSDGLVTVAMHDTRRPGVAASSRESLGTPMGNIVFEPPEADVLKARLEADLARILKARGVTTPRTFECDLLELGVNTQPTPLYWDVVGRVRIVLKDGSRNFELAGTGSEFAFVWPGEEVVRTAFYRTLDGLSTELQKVADQL